MDPTLGQRPQPPDINGHGWSNGGGPPRGGHMGPMGGHIDQSAVRVRQWIETRSVSDVRKIRPVLNQEHKKYIRLFNILSAKNS